ncbi:hypothetical protein OAL68_02670 [Candidatus Pelagibacter sp.]|nr:hypothetical protein [Candidatus Pelagibacter sp.]
MFLLSVGCSFKNTTDSNYWTEKNFKNITIKSNNNKKLPEIFKKVEDITSLTNEEYKIYIDDYTEKSKYPDISK